jgi:plastocyanin
MMAMSKTARARILALAAAAALALAGCNGDDGDDGDNGGMYGHDSEEHEEQTDEPDDDGQAAPDGADVEITISDFDFGGDFAVQAGTEFTVTNNDDVMHTFTADDGEFDSGEILPGETKEITIDEPGAYGFHCQPHPYLTGTVTV